MLSSFATATSSSSSSTYESPPAWWKLNFTSTSYAALATALFPSSVSGSQDHQTSNVVAKQRNLLDHHSQRESMFLSAITTFIRKFYSIERKVEEIILANKCNARFFFLLSF